MEKHIIRDFPLIKIKSEDILDKIINGSIYMNSLSNFRQIEGADGDVVVGDSHEALASFKVVQLVIPGKGVFSLNNELVRTSNSEDFVFCMFGITPNNMHFEFDERQREELLKFGEYALIILDAKEFLRRVQNSAQKNGYNVICGFVKYYDENEDYVDRYLSLFSGMHNIAFWKRKKYSYQQEFRLLVHAPEIEDDHIELDIGSIEDITLKISTEALLKSRIESIDCGG